MLVVAALGQSALASADASALQARIRAIAQALAPVARSHQLVVTHAGWAQPPAGSSGLPADLQAARDAGLIGHLLARELRNALPGATVTSLLAQAVVHCDDGTTQPPAGGSPPCRIVEMPILVELAGRDDRVVCVGCVPVQQTATALLAGGEMRVDHDQAAATLGIELRADILLLLTDVAAVYSRWPEATGRIPSLEAHEAVPEALAATGMGDKLRAACRFARTPGTFAAIGAADDAEGLVAGRAGTCVALSG
jgi:carbamate kinase